MVLLAHLTIILIEELFLIVKSDVAVIVGIATMINTNIGLIMVLIKEKL